MKRFCSSSKINETQRRHVSRLESDPCAAPPSHEARVMQAHVLRTMVDSPDLQVCGAVPFERMTMFHDGTKWVVSLEAIVTDEAPHVAQ